MAAHRLSVAVQLSLGAANESGPLIELAGIPDFVHGRERLRFRDAFHKRPVHEHEGRCAHVREAMDEDLPPLVRLA